MKTALTLFALAAGTTAVAGDALRTDYTQERVLRVERTLSTTSEVVDFRMVVDGEEQEARGFGDRSSSSTRSVVTLLGVEGHADGKPTKVRRTFETLAQKGSTSFGDQSRDFERSSTNEGAVLLVTLGEDGEPKVELVDGDASDELLAAQRLDLELDAFLPEDEVEGGETWDLSQAAIARGLLIGQELALFPREEREAPADGERGGGRGPRGGMRGGGGGLNDEGLGAVEWKGEARLEAETKEHDGVTCRVVHLELEAAGELPERDFGGGRGRDRALGLEPGSTLRGTRLELELEGELLFSVAEGRPVHLSLTGDYTLEMERTMDRGERTMEMSSTTEGELTFEVTVTLED